MSTNGGRGGVDQAISRKGIYAKVIVEHTMSFNISYTRLEIDERMK
jgi:hypothetical protein